MICGVREGFYAPKLNINANSIPKNNGGLAVEMSLRHSSSFGKYQSMPAWTQNDNAQTSSSEPKLVVSSQVTTKTLKPSIDFVEPLFTTRFHDSEMIDVNRLNKG